MSSLVGPKVTLNHLMTLPLHLHPKTVPSANEMEKGN